MKRFTVKNFILYNSPCFNCKNEISFYFEIDPINDYGRVSKRALVTTNYTEVELVIHYANNLKIKIDHKTNKYTASSEPALTEYLSKFKLSLHSRCDRCFSDIVSNRLEFNSKMGFIHPVTLNSENFIIEDKNTTYNVYTYFDGKPQTRLYMARTDPVTKMVSPSQMVLPLIPLYKFKTKSKFLNKIKTYLTFS